MDWFLGMLPAKSPTGRIHPALVMLLGGLSLCPLSGCFGGPKGVGAIPIDPKASAARAMTKLDTNSDGALSESELAASPPLKEAASRIDLNRDKKLSADEIALRISDWLKGGSWQNLSCFVRKRDVPLVGARVRLIPEEFLGDGLKVAEGISDEEGSVVVSVAEADLPYRGAPKGLYPGFYRAEISKEEGGQETIPAEFNQRTTLGFEVGFDSASTFSSPKLQVQ